MRLGNIKLWVVACSLFAHTSFASTLLVANKSAASVSLMQAQTGKVLAVLPTGEAPHEIAVSEDGRWAAISNYGTRETPGNSLTLVDIEQAKVLKTIDLGKYQRPHGMQWMADNRHIVVTVEANQGIIKVDADQGQVVSFYPTGQAIAHMLVLGKAQRYAYVANIGGNNVSRVDLTNQTKPVHLTTGQGAEGIDISKNGELLYVSNRADDNIAVVALADFNVKRHWPSAGFPIRVKTSMNGEQILVTHARADQLHAINTLSGKTDWLLDLDLPEEEKVRNLLNMSGSVPIGVLLTPEGDRAFVAHANADVVSVIDMATGQRTQTWSAGREPDGMGYSRRDVTVNQD